MLVSLFLAASASLPCASVALPWQHPPAQSAPPAKPSDATGARAELVKSLLGLASWANQNELYASRDGVWRAVIALDPDNADARRGLKHLRESNGHWKEPPAHEVKDRKPALQPEFARRRSELVAAWRTQVIETLEREKADRPRRETAYAEILRVDPDDAVVHGLRGEVRGEKSWLLRESVASADRRAQIKKCVQESAQAQVQAETSGPSPTDIGYLPAWKLVRSCEGVRILLQSTEEEAARMVQTEHTARALLQEVCGKPIAPSPGFSAYVIVETGDCDKFLAAVAEATEDDKKNWKLAPGFGIPRRAAVALWDKDPRRRLDCFTRHLVANCLYAGFGIYAKQGWLVEGLGLYLAHELVGTRATWFRPDQAGEDIGLVKRLQDDRTDWLAEARTLCTGPGAPKLAEVLGKPLSEMNVNDMLVATVFAEYLALALPKELPEILERIGRSGQNLESISAVTGRPFPEVEARFVRWLAEVR